jgi:hypothetical protein
LSIFTPKILLVKLSAETAVPFSGDLIIPFFSSCSNWDRTGVGEGAGAGMPSGTGVGSGRLVDVGSGVTVSSVISSAVLITSPLPPLQAEKKTDNPTMENRTRREVVFLLRKILREFDTYG